MFGFPLVQCGGVVPLRMADIFLQCSKVYYICKEAVREGRDILVVIFSLVVIWSLGQVVGFVCGTWLVF